MKYSENGHHELHSRVGVFCGFDLKYTAAYDPIDEIKQNWMIFYEQKDIVVAAISFIEAVPLYVNKEYVEFLGGDGSEWGMKFDFSLHRDMILTLYKKNGGEVVFERTAVNNNKDLAIAKWKQQATELETKIANLNEKFDETNKRNAKLEEEVTVLKEEVATFNEVQKRVAEVNEEKEMLEKRIANLEKTAEENKSVLSKLEGLVGKFQQLYVMFEKNVDA